MPRTPAVIGPHDSAFNRAPAHAGGEGKAPFASPEYVEFIEAKTALETICATNDIGLSQEDEAERDRLESAAHERINNALEALRGRPVTSWSDVVELERAATLTLRDRLTFKEFAEHAGTIEGALFAAIRTMWMGDGPSVDSVRVDNGGSDDTAH